MGFGLIISIPQADINVCMQRLHTFQGQSANNHPWQSLEKLPAKY